jgi:methyl-accepting chemotaxis protein
MARLRDLGIGTRLALAFAALVAITLAVAALALLRMDAVDDVVQRLTHDDYRKVALSNRLADLTRSNGMLSWQAVASPDADARRDAAERIARNRSAVDEVLADLDRALRKPQARELLATIVAARRGFVESFGAALQEARDGRRDAALARLSVETVARLDALSAENAKLVAFQDEVFESSAADARATYERASVILAVLLAVAVATGSLLAWRTTRSVVAPLREAETAAGRLAAGDLASRTRTDRHDEAGRMLASLDAAMGALGDAMRAVDVSARQTALAAGEIAQGNSDLSARTETQAASLEQTAAAVDELSATLKTNAEHAAEADRMATAAAGLATDGGRTIEALGASMRELRDVSERIAGITRTVDEIAFKTNILALNAAVEAARAGESGRSFAVVATEVRALAGQCSSAAADIGRLVQTSVERVQEASGQADASGRAVREIAGAIDQVAHRVAEITRAVGEQAGGLGQINAAVAELDRGTQHNAALVEQLAATATRMREQADALSGEVGRFTLEAA